MNESPFYLKQILNILSEESKSYSIWLTLEKEIIYINDSAAQIYGWSPDEAVGKNFSLLCREDNIEDICLRYLPKMNLDAPVTELMGELKLKDHPVMIIQWNFFPIKDKNDKVSSILITGFDIRKSVQDKTTHLYNIVNNVPHTIFWKNSDSVFLGCNEVFAEFAHLNSPEDIVGLTDYDLPWKKSESDAYRANDKVVMETDQPQLNIEETQTFSDGTSIILQTSKVPLHDKNGHVNGVLGVYTDITEQKNTQKALEKAKKNADELKKITYLLEGAKLISSSIAHEIRTPLATIKSIIWNIDHLLTEIVENRNFAHQDVVDIKKGLDNINKKVDQSNVIINMLLTKLQSIDFEFSEFSTCSASDSIGSALNEFTIPSEMVKKISFNKNNDFNFYGSRVLITHVIMNLLKNAIFFILKAGKGDISIWLEQHKTENEIHFKDTGLGIPQIIQPKIFDTFFTTESSTGSGVGLAFCKMVMQSHRGKIDCISKEGKFTEFILSFPLLDNYSS